MIFFGQICEEVHKNVSNSDMISAHVEVLNQQFNNEPICILLLQVRNSVMKYFHD